MSVKSIKRLLRDSVYSHMTTQMATELAGTTVVKPFAGTELATSHIRITTPTSTPHIVGSRNQRRWTVQCHITVVTQTDDITEDVHDDLVGLCEAWVLQVNATLSAALTTAEIQVDRVYPGESQELEFNSMRHSASVLVCECFML